MGQESSVLVDENVPPVTLSARNISAVAEYIKEKPRRIVVLTGAGISTAAGIPDFRSPGTGLYSNLARLNLPHAEAVFDISYFRENPEPFYVLAKELYPGKFHPTVSHAFISLLARKSVLDFLFTQNIDCLERRAGVPADKIVEAHGSFASQRCIDCKREFPDDKIKEHVDEAKVPRCEDEKCGGLVKPDITFFGESLPKEFDRQSHRMTMADLVLVIGTSLSVYPFAALPDMIRDNVPRVLFNLEQVGSMGTKTDDVLVLGDCDNGIRQLADELGWRDELEELWRDIVGDKEAERQLASRIERENEVEDEVDQLTRKVDTALHLEEQDEKADAIPSHETNIDASTSSEDVSPKKTAEREESKDKTNESEVNDAKDTTSPEGSEKSVL